MLADGWVKFGFVCFLYEIGGGAIEKSVRFAGNVSADP